MRIAYRLLLSLSVAIIAAVTFRVVHAQDMDENSLIVSEDMTIEESLSDDLLEDEEDMLEVYTGQDADDALSDALGQTLDVSDPDADASADPVADLLGEQPVDDVDPLADLEIAPVEDAPALEDAVPAVAPAFDAPLVEAISQPAEPDADLLSDLELGEVPAEPAEPEAQPEAPSDQDMLSDLLIEDVAAPQADALIDDAAPADDELSGLEDLAVEDVPVDAGDASMPDDLKAFQDGAAEKGVPAELLAEETALSETLEDVADLGADDLLEDALLDDTEDDMPAEDAGDEMLREVLGKDVGDLDADAGDMGGFEELAGDSVDEDPFDDGADMDALPADSNIEEPVAEAVIQRAELPVAAIEELLQAEANFVNGVKGTAEPAEEMRRDVVDGDAQSIRLIKESEALRREAVYRHTLVLIEQARQANEDYNHTKARTLFEQVLKTLRGMGDRPEIAEARRAAEQGVTDSMFGRAKVLFEELDLENALKLASEASQRGHRGATRLASRIKKEMVDPAPVAPEDIRRWDETGFVKKKTEIRNRLREGREHYMVGEFDEAQIAFESILNIDPHNTEAIRWREKVSQRKYDRASMELESTRRDMINIVRETWNPRVYAQGTTRDEDVGITDIGTGPTVRPEEKIRQKMEKIIIPEIDFRQANIHDVIDFIQQASVDFDRSEDKRKGVNIILNLGESGAGGDGAGGAGGAGGEFDFFPDESGTEGGDVAVDLITFRAREITLLESLRIVTEVANLIYRIQGSVVMILPFDAPLGDIIHRDYDVLPTVRDTMSRLSTDIGGGDRGGGDFIALDEGGFETETTDWESFFGELGVAWPRGSSIKYIPAIGKLLVANTADNLAILEQRLAQLNVIPKQIEIEARFVEVNQTDLNSLGFEYFITDDVELAQKKNQAGLPLSQRERLVLRAGEITTGNRFLTDPVPQGSGLDVISASDNILTFASLLTNPELSIVLHALEQKGNTDLLSAPKVTTQSGVEAQIKVVTEFIYPSDYTVEPGVPPTVTAGGIGTLGTPPVVTPAEFETREVGVILNVLPEVTPDSQMISLTMSPEVVTEPEWRNFGQTFVDGQGNVQTIPIEQPFFNSRSISTSILIYNGATVVMGGMITEEREQAEDKIPLLGDIPIIGRLFRSSYDNSVKRNLLIFVTARLVTPDGRTVGGTVTDALSDFPE